MGMYTEFHFNVKLKTNVDSKILATLEFMLSGLSNKCDLSFKTPDHELFETDRWRYMLRCNSYYFPADTHSTLRHDDIRKNYHLCIRCNLKNYSGEIEKFIDWIKPHIDAFDGDFLGFSRYEETDDPTLIHY